MKNASILLQQTQSELADARVRITALETELAQTHTTGHRMETVAATIADYCWNVFVLANEQGRITYANPALTRVMGYPIEEYLSQGINDLVHPDDRALAENNFQELLAHPGDGRTTELRLQHKDGRWLWLEITAVNYLNDPQVAAILFSSHDITTYKAKEHALQANFERYRLLADTIPDALYVAAIGPDQRPTRVLEVNERACQMLGYSRDELLQMNVYDINALGSHISPEVTERMDKGEHVLFEQVHRKHDGTPIPVEVHVRRGLIDGQPVLIGLAHDISHRKLIESELRRFEAAIRQTGDAIVITDAQLDRPPDILFVNEAFTKITGYTVQDAVERKINLMQLSIIGFFDHEEVAVLHDAIRSGSVYRGIIPSRHKNGTLLTLQWSITPITDQQGLVTHHIAVIRDITEQEKQVAQTRAIKNDLQTQRDQFNDILNTMQDALMSISLVDRQLICASASFKSIFGYPPEAFIQDANFFRQVVHPDDLERTVAAMQTALRDGFIELEHRVLWPDGQVRWLLRRAWVNYDKNGRPIRVNDSARDITERKQAQEALKESEETHRLILGSISDAVFVTDASGTFSFICPNVHVIFGYSRTEVTEMGRIDRLLGNVSFNADTLANVGEIANIEHQILDKSNQPHDLLVTVKLVTLHTGTVLYTCRDITERKHAEDALRASEERLRSVISSVNAHIYVTKITRDKTFINEYMSPNITTISGFSPQKFLDDWNFWLTLVNPDDLPACELQLQKLIAGQSSIVEYRLRLENEHEIWVQDNAKVVSHPDGTMTVFATVQDITERKQAELALIESEQKLRLFVEYSPAAIAMLDKNMRYISVSRRWLTDYRLKEEDITGHSHYEVFPEIPERWKEIHRRCLQGAVETSDADPFPRADGTLDWVHWEIRPWRDVNHEVGGILLFSEVITERINAQDALRASEERYRQMFELHGLPKLIIDPQNGRILDANPAAATFYGYDRATLCTLNIFDINLSPQHEVETKMAKAADSEMLFCEFVHRGAGGDPRHVEVFTGPVEIDGRKLLYSIITDVTEKEQAKAALQEAHDLLEQRVIQRTAELEKSNNRLEAIFNHSGDAIVLLDIIDGIQQANYAFDAIFNLSEKQYLGAALTRYLHPQDMDRVTAIIQQVAHTHQGQRIETRIQQPDASIIDLEINIAPVNRSQHAVNSLVCIIRDVTERKQAERAIAEERNLLRTVIDTVPDYIYVKDNHHRMVLNNVAHARSLKVQSTVDAVGKTDFEIFPARLAAKFHADEEKLFETRKAVVNVEERSIGQDGREIWALTTKVPLLNLQGELIGLVGITHDVSDLKAQEQALRRSELQLRESQKMLQLVLDTIPVRVFWKNRESVYLGCNRLFADDAGLARTADIIGKTDDDMPWGITEAHAYRADDRHVMENNIAKLDYEEILTTVNGQQMYVQTSKLPLSSADDKVIGILGAYSDITARKQAEAALAQKLEDERQMQEHLKALHEITLHLTRTQSLDEFYHCAVEQGLAHLGFERLGLMLYDHHTESALGTYGTDALGQLYDEHHIRLLPNELTGVLQRMMDRSERFAFEEKTPLFANFVPIGEGSQAVASLWNGELLGWLSIDNGLHHQPITKNQLDILALYALATGSLLARKRTELALRESEERYRLLAENISDFVTLADMNGSILYASPSYLRSIGLTFEELKRLTRPTLIHPDDLPGMSHLYASFARGEVQNPYEYRRRTASGEYIWVELYVKLLTDEQGKVFQILTSSRDITARKLTEIALRESEARYRLLAENISDFVTLSDTVGDPLYASPSYLRSIGLTFEELKSMNRASLVHPDDLPEVAHLYGAFARGEVQNPYEYRRRAASDDYIWVELYVKLITDEQGKVLQILTSSRDITERKLTEIALRESEERYRLIAENVSDVIIKLSPSAELTFATPSFTNLLGYPLNEVIGTDGFKLVHPDDAPQVLAIMNTSVASAGLHFTLTERLRHKDGHYLWVEVTNTNIYHPDTRTLVEMVGVLRDITERKQAEEALREREERLRVLFETSPDAICLVRLDGTLLDINPAGLLLGGFTREQVIGKHFRELNLYSKPYLEQVEDGLSLTRSGGSRVAEYEVTTARGELVVIESVTHPITINGELMQLAVIRDITDRRKAEEDLRQSETRYRTTVATMYEGVVVQGIDGAIQLCNAAAERILGLTVDQMMGRTSVDPRWRAVHEDGSPFPGETHPAMVTLHTGQPQSNVLMGIHKPDDTLSWILINSQPLLAAGQSQPYAVVTTFADITERQQAEAALRQALAQEKELGELKSRFVSMASHEFRTPLAAILAAAETLKAYREKMTPTQIESRLEKIRSQVLHMKDIMEDVLQLARIQAGRVEFNPLLADLHLLCQDIVDEFEGQPQHHGRVHYSGSLFPVDLPYDSRLMRQIISNLISNALKYSPVEKPIFITLTQDSTHVTLQVRDEGIGIPSADLKRLFEPFHRATNVGTISGTGLGLSITKQAVEMHHGTITPDTEIGQGTTFTVILPKTSESQPTAQ